MSAAPGMAPKASASQAPFIELYGELRALAQWHLRSERPEHTLQSTALVHEAYLRLSSLGPGECLDRNHFLSLAAKVMRQVLVDHARSRNRLKRGADPERVTLAEVDADIQVDDPLDIRLVDAALDRLAELDWRQARIVELRFFAGMSIPEIAGMLSLSPETVKRDWAMARAWLRRRLRG